jgi:copper chaperone CopZ
MSVRPLSAALVVMFLSVLSAPARAQVEEVRLTVDGLTCNLCAAGLDRSLRRVDGATGVRVTLTTQIATMRLKAGVPVAPGQLRAAVERAGQRLRGVELRLRGTLQRDKGQYQLRPPDLAQIFSIRSDARLETLAGKSVRVHGRLMSSDAPAVELEVIDVAP